MLKQPYGPFAAIAFSVSLASPQIVLANDGLNTILKFGAGMILLNEQNKQKNQPRAGSQQRTSSKQKVSSSVQKAQSLLNQLGFDAGTADGLMGRNTRGAITEFRRAYAIEGGTSVNSSLLNDLQNAVDGSIQPLVASQRQTGTVDVNGFASSVQPLQPAIAANSEGLLLSEEEAPIGQMKSNFSSGIQPLQPAFVLNDSGSLEAANENVVQAEETIQTHVQPLQPFIANIDEPKAKAEIEPHPEIIPAPFDILGVHVGMSLSEAIETFEIRASDWAEPSFSRGHTLSWIRDSANLNETIILLGNESGLTDVLGRVVLIDGLTSEDVQSALSRKYGHASETIANENIGIQMHWIEASSNCEIRWQSFSERFPIFVTEELITAFPKLSPTSQACKAFLGARIENTLTGSKLSVWSITSTLKESFGAIPKMIKPKLDL